MAASGSAEVGNHGPNQASYERLRAVFVEVCDLAGDERDAALRRACGDDDDLRRRVETLLARDADDDRLRPGPATSAPGARFAHLATQLGAAPVPESIGSYRIRRVIAEGGMGTVYEAEQERPRRVVALKVLRPGWAAPSMLRRFEFEVDVLGRLNHPGIAQILEAGVAETGVGPQPYFAMELIDGMPVVDYARTRLSRLDERLELLARIGEAVQHAHLLGVVHRDLKPANILVTDDGRPKVLDFGVARATERAALDAPLRTETGLIVGTLPYMSPEQARGDAIDPRTDVYALGVLAYEVLAGRLPYDLDGRPVPEALRVITDVAPRALGAVDRRLRGDVETIVGAALAKDRERRYQSAGEMAADLRAILERRPIKARPPSHLYLLRTCAARHRGRVAGLAAAVLLLVLVAVTAGLVHVLGERDAAEAERTQAEASRDEWRVVGALVSDLLSPDEAPGRGGTERMLDALDGVSSNLEDGGPPSAADAAMHEIVAMGYVGLGEDARAHEHLIRAGAIRRDLDGGGGGDVHLSALRAVATIGSTYMKRRMFEDAERVFREYVPIAEERLGRDHELTLTMLGERARALHALGSGTSALACFFEIYERQSTDPSANPKDVASTMLYIASAYTRMGRMDAAESWNRWAAEYCEQRLDDDAMAIGARLSLLVHYTREERFDEADALEANLLDRVRCTFGPHHARTIMFLQNCAWRHEQRGHYAMALERLHEVHEAFRALHGECGDQTVQVVRSLARLTALEGRIDEAVRLNLQVVEARRAVFGDESMRLFVALESAAQTLVELDRDDDAAPLLAEAIDIARRHVADFPLAESRARTTYGALLMRRERYADAEAQLRAAYGQIAEREANDDRASDAAVHLVRLYEAWSKPEEAAQWAARGPAMKARR